MPGGEGIGHVYSKDQNDGPEDSTDSPTSDGELWSYTLTFLKNNTCAHVRQFLGSIREDPVKEGVAPAQSCRQQTVEEWC